MDASHENSHGMIGAGWEKSLSAGWLYLSAVLPRKGQPENRHSLHCMGVVLRESWYLRFPAEFELLKPALGTTCKSISVPRVLNSCNNSLQVPHLAK